LWRGNRGFNGGKIYNIHASILIEGRACYNQIIGMRGKSLDKNTVIEPDFTLNPKEANFYDDPEDDYEEYWKGREYESAAEEMAIRLILKGKKFDAAADIGGGFGRLSKLLTEFAREVTLVEPSSDQLKIAERYLVSRDGD
jgi:AdoMet dependent proline di-methyltransferase